MPEESPEIYSSTWDWDTAMGTTKAKLVMVVDIKNVVHRPASIEEARARRDMYKRGELIRCKSSHTVPMTDDEATQPCLTEKEAKGMTFQTESGHTFEMTDCEVPTIEVPQPDLTGFPPVPMPCGEIKIPPIVFPCLGIGPYAPDTKKTTYRNHWLDKKE